MDKQVQTRNKMSVKNKNFGKSEDYWEGFDTALELIDDMYASTHPHPLNIADCVKFKMNRIPKSKIRKNLSHKAGGMDNGKSTSRTETSK